MLFNLRALRDKKKTNTLIDGETTKARLHVRTYSLDRNPN